MRAAMMNQILLRLEADGLIDQAQEGMAEAERGELLRLLGKFQDNLLQIARAEKAPLEDIEARPVSTPRRR